MFFLLQVLRFHFMFHLYLRLHLFSSFLNFYDYRRFLFIPFFPFFSVIPSHFVQFLFYIVICFYFFNSLLRYPFCVLTISLPAFYLGVPTCFLVLLSTTVSRVLISCLLQLFLILQFNFSPISLFHCSNFCSVHQYALHC